MGFLDTEEGATASGLIEAINNGDEELLQNLKRKQVIMFLDNEVCWGFKLLLFGGRWWPLLTYKFRSQEQHRL
jgi:hypothetical protein